MRKLAKSYSYLVLSLCLVIFLVACSRVNQANFDKVQSGMTLQEVTAILGEPTSSDSVDFGGLSGTSTTWKNDNAVINIMFLNNKVQIKNFSKDVNPELK